MLSTDKTVMLNTRVNEQIRGLKVNDHTELTLTSNHTEVGWRII